MDTKTTVRALREGEEQSFLTVMCDAFSLDIFAAKSIFYDDPFYNLAHKRVLVDNETQQIFSCLTIVPAQLRVNGGAVVPVAGIAGVCTTRNCRRKGYASQLLHETLRTLYEEFGFAAAALSARQKHLYQNVGFETCSIAAHWKVRRSSLPSFAESKMTEELIGDNLADAGRDIIELHESIQSSQPGSFIRNSQQWSAIFSSSNGCKTIVWRDAGSMQGCAIYRRIGTGTDTSIHVQDIFTSTPRARRGIIGYFAAMEQTHWVTGESSLSDLKKLRLQDAPLFTSSQRKGVMIAITNFEACISAVASTGKITSIIRKSASGLTIRLETALSPSDLKPVRLFSVNSSPEDAAITLTPADEMSGDWISLDTGAMSQLFFGYKTARELKATGSLLASSATALQIADTLFSSYNTFLGPLDMF